MTDITPVVLTLGEKTTERAIAAARAQTPAIADVIVIEEVRPFHRAFNTAARAVGTEFFLQVDADMVLDCDCAAVLRDAMGPSVAITLGALRDPLMGRLAGVKLFRRECAAIIDLEDSVAPDVDHYRRLGRLGWQTQCVVGGARARGPTLGRHDPTYGVEYVFGTYLLLGSRYLHSRDGVGLAWRLGRLRGSRHPMALAARLALGHGLFVGEQRDVAKPLPSPDSVAVLRMVTTQAEVREPTDRRVRRWLGLLPDELVSTFHALGRRLRADSPASLGTCLRRLAASGHPNSLWAELSLAHGALGIEAGREPELDLPRAMAVLRRAVPRPTELVIAQPPK